jgi:hypothetical protein
LKEPHIRTFRNRFVDLANPETDFDLLNHFHRRQEIIQEGTEGAVQVVESIPLCGGIETVIANIFTDARVIFLFHEVVVIFVIGSVAGNMDDVKFTPVPQPFVDKLRVIVAIDAQKGEGEGLGEGNEAFEAPFWGFIE